jgi:hypothetical protein
MQRVGAITIHPWIRSWNSTVAAHPINVIATFGFTQSCTTLGLFTLLNTFAAFPPELAVGYVVAKLSKKFRQPLNFFIAAGVAKVLPQLTLMKISPLIFFLPTELTGTKKKDDATTADTPTLNKAGRKRVYKSSAQEKEGGESIVIKGMKYLQGPIDKYGMAYYLTTKATAIATVGTAAAATSYGIDLVDVLSGIGMSNDMVTGMGGLAGAALANTLFLPLHFYATNSLTMILANSMNEYVGSDYGTDEEKRKASFEGKMNAIAFFQLGGSGLITYSLLNSAAGPDAMSNIMDMTKPLIPK